MSSDITNEATTKEGIIKEFFANGIGRLGNAFSDCISASDHSEAAKAIAGLRKDVYLAVQRAFYSVDGCIKNKSAMRDQKNCGEFMEAIRIYAAHFESLREHVEESKQLPTSASEKAQRCYDAECAFLQFCPQLFEEVRAFVDREVVSAKSEVTRQGMFSETVGTEQPDDMQRLNAKHSDDYRSVNWYGTTYEFTTNQAICVEKLWRHWILGGLSVSADAMTGDAMATTRLDVVFRDHPAWGTMITSGMTKGTYRLAEPTISSPDNRTKAATKRKPQNKSKRARK
jgi:hypothetical protein